MTPVIRAQAVALFKEGVKVTVIAEKVGFSRGSVYYTTNKYKKERSFEVNEGRGRKPIFTDADIQYIKTISLRDRRKTVPEI